MVHACIVLSRAALGKCFWVNIGVVLGMDVMESSSEWTLELTLHCTLYYMWLLNCPTMEWQCSNMPTRIGAVAVYHDGGVCKHLVIYTPGGRHSIQAATGCHQHCKCFSAVRCIHAWMDHGASASVHLLLTCCVDIFRYVGFGCFEFLI